MTPKLKSLIYLMCFILCCLIYNHLEQQEEEKSVIKNSNFATMEMTDMNEAKDLDLEKELNNE